ncbi:TauD/TfdA family dioxygenase [Actinomadura macrotermitis]|uniref:TauD/TfdA-like domain-containing protein n=1 Tax=Actinomadura macrotermitis TaxID=2585200 RepID=A0A7K0BLR2_9ACTN|nr:TauD/TfdA family dioxygenase [Actinomadura macrotermitis]MQY02120.1 hypothetical protein [Actinomadura macrotermitis]
MTTGPTDQFTFPGTLPGTPRRRGIDLSAPELVTIDAPAGAAAVVRPRTAEVDLADWLRNHRRQVERLLHDRGAVRFQRFGVTDAAGFEQVSRSLGGDGLLDYVYGSTPRHREKGGVYTSTEYPADQTIPQHNEMAYARRWPMKLWFFCRLPAASGGATPLADSRRVLRRIDPALRRRFTERGVRYVRNYGGGLDLSWQQAFETGDRAEAERACRDLGLEFAWSGDRLRTWQVCPAVVRHPVTGEAAWFNQAHLFHPSSLPAEVRDSLLAASGEEDLPRNAQYGDGTRIEDSALEEIRRAFEAETVAEPWSAGEVLLIDNVLMSHGRQPYQGPRKVLVAMTDPRQTISDQEDDQ